MSDNAGVESIVQHARNAFLGRFGWHDGHADVWRVFNDADAFAAIVAGLAEPWRGRDVTKVCGIESRGFLLGGPVAIALGAGFVAMRKRDALFPGLKYEIETESDYRGRRHVLQIRQDSITAGERVLFVDDWIERGSQASVGRDLVEACGGSLVGMSVIVDQLDAERRRALPPITSLVATNHLPDDAN
jgi:adenine phosphoribosyltransferase